MRTARAGLVAVCVFAPALCAHHSVLQFDGTRGVTLAGTVARVRWQNPHAQLVLEMAADSKAERWTVEIESPLVLERLGWTSDTVRAGDSLTVLGAPAKDGSRALRCKHVTLADGRTLACFP